LVSRSDLIRARRHGISELMGMILTVVITLIAGAALFGYVNGQAASNENQIGAANAANVNFLNERFQIPQMTFKYTSPTNQISIYVYNNGHLTDSFVEAEIYTTPRSSMDLLYYYCSPATAQTSTLCKLPQTPFTSLSGNWVVDLNNKNNNNCYGSATSLESPVLEGTGGLQVSIGNISYFTLTLLALSSPCVPSPSSFSSGSFYFIQLTGQYGNTATYFQMM
jgi:hypothetical protein